MTKTVDFGQKNASVEKLVYHLAEIRAKMAQIGLQTRPKWPGGDENGVK